MTLKTGRVYVLADPNGKLIYVGSTMGELSDRLQQHKKAVRDDPLSSPLYRYCAENCGGSMADWSIRLLTQTIFDDSIVPLALKQAEACAINSLTTRGERLLNKNSPVDLNGARREYMRQWRRDHPGYMAAAGRTHRELRRERAAAFNAEQQTHEEQQ